jgi:hypothetical protein
MTLINSKEVVNVNELIDSIKISFICPRCKASKELEFPKSVVDNKNNLTTISIPKYLVCEHSFQAFVDKNYKIRGYQSVDFEFEPKTKRKGKKPPTDKELRRKREEQQFFESVITEGNYMEYFPKDYQLPKKKIVRKKPQVKTHEDTHSTQKLIKIKEEHTQKKTNVHDKGSIILDGESINEERKNKDSNSRVNGKSLKEIYEDFWDYIEDDNETFRKFIIQDERRKNKNIINLFKEIV